MGSIKAPDHNSGNIKADAPKHKSGNITASRLKMSEE